MQEADAAAEVAAVDRDDEMHGQCAARPQLKRWIAPSGAKLPTAKTIVANSTSHGTRPANTELGVDKSRSAPSNPPKRLSRKKPVTLTSVMPKMLRR